MPSDATPKRLGVVSLTPDPVTGLWEDGAIVIQSAKGCWDGAFGFVPGWGKAAKFRPCDPSYREGLALAEKNTGERCWIIYLQPPSS
jgi:hypothetical protein